jgi:hypothetical protein
MPRYFFNTVDGRRYPDEDGTDLPDLESAHRKATLVLAELLREQPMEVWESGHLGIEVTDEAGELVARLRVSAGDADKPS